jgi:hypothetical protein
MTTPTNYGQLLGIGRQDTSSLMFFAGFHLSIPLAISRMKSSQGWTEIRQELQEIFAQHKDKFSVVKNYYYDPEFQIPAGEPIFLRSKIIHHVFQWEHYLQNQGVSFKENEFELNNIIWICPTGVVLIIVNIISKEGNLPSLNTFSNIVADRYSELTFIFNQVSEIVYSLFDNTSSDFITFGIEEYRRNIEAIELQRTQNVTNKPEGLQLLEWFESNPQIKTLYESILIDVYRLELIYSKDVSLRIGYAESTIVSDDPNYPLSICIVHASWIHFFWLNRMLNETAQLIQENHIKDLPYRARTASDLRLMRVFSLQFISQSAPISIRLTREYFLAMETCWSEWRLHPIVEQVNDQLVTLEVIIATIENIRNGVRNFKIGIAALFVGLISIVAVTAQVIDTLDVHSQFNLQSRLQSLLFGFLFGALSISIIYFYPFAKLRQ